MPDDGNTGRTVNANTRQGYSSWFAVPAPLKRLFDKFPLKTYPNNDFPASAVRDTAHHSLYIFTTDEDARDGAPSFNPGCLRWQTYLKIIGVDFRTIASNNHASPTGSLPFLITRSSEADETNWQTISSRGLRTWTASQSANLTAIQETKDVRYEAYEALIEGRLRVAWLYQLYIDSRNEPIVRELYLSGASSNTLVQAAIAHQLQQAADAELRRTSFLRRREEAELWREAKDALFALSTLLGEQEWFFDGRASDFDASVFSYTHLILDTERMGWRSNRLRASLETYENLVRHRDRMLAMYY